MKSINHPSNWKFSSTEEEGLHEIVSPDNSACKATWVYRLNLPKGKEYTVKNDQLELNGALIHGAATVKHISGETELGKLGSFYLPAGDALAISAQADCSLFIGGSFYEGKGRFFARKYDLSLPLGDIRQVHGKPPYQRDVFMTIAQQDEGSRLICGITYGEPGAWTSWPPHQHSANLEEVYCYFDIPKPQSAFHFSSRKEGEFEFVHPVSTGDCVIVPEGYHPTCGMPGVKSCYFWVMAAHRPESRRYDLAVNDPNYS